MTQETSTGVDVDIEFYWTIRIYCGEGKWGETRIGHPLLAEQTFDRQVALMPNCPIELVESRVIRHHMT